MRSLVSRDQGSEDRRRRGWHRHCRFRRVGQVPTGHVRAPAAARCRLTFASVSESQPLRPERDAVDRGAGGDVERRAVAAPAHVRGRGVQLDAAEVRAVGREDVDPAWQRLLLEASRPARFTRSGARQSRPDSLSPGRLLAVVKPLLPDGTCSPGPHRSSRYRGTLSARRSRRRPSFTFMTCSPFGVVEEGR